MSKSKGDVLVDRSADIEEMRIGEVSRVAIGRRQKEKYEIAAANGLAAQRDILERDPIRELHGPDEPQPDFRIDGPQAHGIAGLAALFGIESPGLTASLAIGEEVAGRLGV